MLFQTFSFALIFLPLLLAAYYSLASNESARQLVLLAGSLTFYGWWDARFIPLLVAQVTLTWLVSKSSNEGRSRLAIVIGVCLNMLSLVTFKYLDFLLASIEAAAGITLPRANIVLPIGISFFSFQLISYLVDLSRGHAPIYPFRQFALFVMVFPHLIAGPIVRHNELIPQFAEDPRRPGLDRRLGMGMILFALGFTKKVFVADPLARIVDPLFLASASLTFGEAWTAALGFSFQLFLDFSAYTEMAIGIALMFGLVLPENFNRPYIAIDIQEFWRRWHISLSTFIRDYLYIPLGGSRNGRLRYVAATFGTMGLCGLWHGAGWTFIAWGVWHGVGLIVCHAWRSLRTPLPQAVAWAVTILFVVFGWVLFRSREFGSAVAIWQSMVGSNGVSGTLEGIELIAAGAVFSAAVPSAHTLIDRWLVNWRPLALATVGIAAAAFVYAGRSDALQFIYFQF